MRGWRTLRVTLLLLICCAYPAQAALFVEENLPYGGLVSEELAQQLAVASAWEQAATKAGEILGKDKVIRLAELPLPEIQAMALMSGMAGQPEIETRARQGIVRARVEIKPAPIAPSQKLADNTGRQRRAELLQELRTLLPEALLLTRKASALRLDRGARGEAVVMERLHFLSDHIVALMAYVPMLDEYNTVWEHPTRQLPQMEKLHEKAPYSPIIATALGELYMQNDRPLAALEALNKAMRLNPGHRVLSLRGMAQWWLGRPALAEEDMNRAIALYPEQVDYWLIRGSIRRDREDYSAMCGDYHQACVMGQCDALAGANNLCEALNQGGN